VVGFSNPSNKKAIIYYIALLELSDVLGIFIIFLIGFMLSRHVFIKKMNEEKDIEKMK